MVEVFKLDQQLVAELVSDWPYPDNAEGSAIRQLRTSLNLMIKLLKAIGKGSVEDATASESKAAYVRAAAVYSGWCASEIADRWKKEGEEHFSHLRPPNETIDPQLIESTWQVLESFATETCVELSRLNVTHRLQGEGAPPVSALAVQIVQAREFLRDLSACLTRLESVHRSDRMTREYSAHQIESILQQ